MKTFALLFCASLGIMLFGGCSTNKPATVPSSGETANYMPLDSGVQKSVKCTGLQLGKTADGRMKVSANLRNLENRRIEVQANCVFKDAQHFTLDETPFRTVILDENATQGVTFEAFNTDAVNYTIRVREAR